jgi:hypothetical protein
VIVANRWPGNGFGPPGKARSLSGQLAGLGRTLGRGLLICAAVAVPAPTSAQDETNVIAPNPSGAPPAAPPGALEVYLMTMGQGEAIWEHFGHNALVIQDPETGTSVAWNWGLFDFRQSDFVARFLRGEMMYWMDGFDASATVRAYERQDRSVWLDRLALTQEQARELKRFVEWNAEPDNRFYRYDYFVDNCSTRVRDALDQVLGGALEGQFGDTSAGFGYRHETGRLTGRATFDYLGIDLLLGPRGDTDRTQWEQMFTPLYLRDRLLEATVLDAQGSPVPLIIESVQLFAGSRPAPAQTPPRILPVFLLLGLVIAAAFAGLGALASRSGVLGRLPLALLAGVWSLLAGVGGLILLLVYGTAHVWMYGNENILQLSPVSLVLAVGAPLAVLRTSPPRLTRTVAWIVAAIAGLGLVAQVAPGIDQRNGAFIALALPAHIGLAWALTRLAERRATRSIADGSETA